MPRTLVLVALFACAFVAHPLADSAPVDATYQDTYITHDPASQVWSLGNGGIELVLAFDASGALVVQQLWNPATGSTLAVDHGADTSVTLGGIQSTLSVSGATMMFVGYTAETLDNGVRLTLIFQYKSLNTTIRRVYACYTGSPTIEMWTRLEAASGASPVQVSNIVGWQLTMPTAPVRWVDGLRGENASDANPDPDTFTDGGGILDDGVETDIGAVGRSSEAFEPIVFVDDGSEEFYGGVIWSGAWRISMLRTGGSVAVSALFPGTVTTLTPDKPVEFPHTFFGYTDDSVQAQTAALRQFVLGGIRKGRPLQPLVTYNTWFPYGATITEADVEAEMHREASLGAELFVLDAGWWTGAGTNGPNDFSTGLGSYAPDPDRFPGQLFGLSDEAHALGMKFGLWVEPERIALSTLGQPGSVLESWLATTSGSYDSDGITAQLCLGSPAARKWVLNKLATLIDTVHPDYIKWDNNFWINCDRLGHGHGAGDGNFAHVLGLYTLLNELRERYPNLLIENVSGGGNRLDYGLMAYSDSAWMDDLTFPSSHVRHNIEGLSSLFPPAYLLSFVIDSGEEPLDGPDLPDIVRSRGLGILGLTWRATDLADDVSLGIAEQIAHYKLLRDTITQSAATLLDAQAPIDEDGWDVVQEVAGDQQTALIFAFRADDSNGEITIHLQNLSPDVTYDITSVDNGPLGSISGANLISDGLSIVHAAGQGSLAHVIVLTAE